MFEGVKSFSDLHINKIRGVFDEYTNPEYFYFFNYFDRLAFIKRSRKKFEILVSCQCGFCLALHKGDFDVFGVYDDLPSAISAFKRVIGFILKPKTFFLENYINPSDDFSAMKDYASVAVHQGDLF